MYVERGEERVEAHHKAR